MKLSMHDFVMGYLSPVYDFLGRNWAYIVIVVTIILTYILLRKLSHSIPRKAQVGSTNKWFNWDEYKEYKKSHNDSQK